MIGSTFILNILDLLLNDDELGIAIRPQIDHVTDAVYNYTGVGLYVTFECDEKIVRSVGEEQIILDGVTITSPELNIGASAALFLKEGIINYLNIWSFDGEYPRKELSTYTLKQEGNWSSGREIKYDGN
jgi:hypothetical protein